MTFFIIALLVIAGLVAWKFRVPLLAKVLGQPEHRIQRQLNRKKR